MSADRTRWGAPAPMRLPANERLLWQGAPRWRGLACRVFHVRAVGLYFALVVLADMAGARQHGTNGMGALAAALPAAATGLAVLAILLGLAWATARTTRYTIGTGHLVLQFGIALPATLVLPLHRIAEAGVRVRRDHSGDILLRLFPGQRLAYVKLWPHVRPWGVVRAEPMLREVAGAGPIATALCRALASADEARHAREMERLAAD